MTNPATWTIPIDLPADVQLAAFFVTPFIKCTLTRNFLTVNRDL
jgi:hypothetical protein